MFPLQNRCSKEACKIEVYIDGGLLATCLDRKQYDRRKVMEQAIAVEGVGLAFLPSWTQA